MAENTTDYSTIDQPYDQQLNRSEPGTDNGSVQEATVKNDGAMSDVWIKNFIRSENWKPKSVGFYIDGQSGKAEFSNVSISGEVDAIGGTIGGFTITADALVGIGGGIIEIHSLNAGSSAKIKLSENDVSLYDDTTGGGNTVTGNSAQIKFLRTDDSSETLGFLVTKRVGKDYDADNVLEMYPPSDAGSGRFNVWFNGRSGDTDAGNLGYYGIFVDTRTSKTRSTAQGGALNGRFEVRLSRNGVAADVPAIVVYDARMAFSNDSMSGQVAGLFGSGNNGIAGFGYRGGSSGAWVNEFLLYSDGYRSLRLGSALTPDDDGAYDIGSEDFRVKDIYMSGSLYMGSGGGGGNLNINVTSTGTSYFNGRLKIPVGTNLYN